MTPAPPTEQRPHMRPTSHSVFEHGACLVVDFISPEEELAVLEAITRAPWSTELRRRVQHYGVRYDYRARNTDPLTPAAALPPWAERMAAALLGHFNGARATQCIVNEYRPGQGIGMHADHPRFGPVVASVSLGASWPMHFRPRSARPYARFALPGDEVALLPQRSALVLSGPARTHWMHGIDPATTATEARTRISATFRTIR